MAKHYSFQHCYMVVNHIIKCTLKDEKIDGSTNQSLHIHTKPYCKTFRSFLLGYKTSNHILKQMHHMTQFKLHTKLNNS